MALPPQHLNGISLCTGGGGLDLGLELAVPAARSVVLVEREAFSVAHLVAAIKQGLLAPAAIWSDVRTFDGRPWRGVVDFLIGGIPCQPHSLAGKKRGSLDERDLWSDARRIIVQSRPWFVWIENVRGMLSAGADEVAGAERVLRDLRRLGYTVECGLFTAFEVGSSHLRPRIFILGVANTEVCGPAKRSGSRASGHRQAAIGTAHSGRPLAHTKRDGWRQGDAWSSVQQRASEPDASGDRALANTGSAGREGGAATCPAGSREQRRAFERSGGPLANTDVFELRRESPTGQQQVDERDLALSGADLGTGYPALYPPGPADLDGWRRVLAHSPDLEPSVRRMADGLATRLDLSGPHAARVDRIRLLGNGVVSLEAAYAFRTLVSRLASTGHAGAAELARLMEAQP